MIAIAALRTLNSPISGSSKRLVAEREVRARRAEYVTSRICCAQFAEKPISTIGAQRFLRDLHAVRIVAIQQHHSVLRHDLEQMPEAQS